MNFHNWLLRREIGLLPNHGDRDFIMRRVFKSIAPSHHWNDSSDKFTDVGGVFNLEFSPEGNVLVAACEKKSILLFDAITTKQTQKIPDAHTSNVNCIKFLDNRRFATCSDDTTVALWDLRYLKMKVRSLHGHSNWVKNIEYSHKDNLLVTSGFDGSIFTWDINSHTEQGLIYQKVFHTSGLMRCRIAPDSTKLVICTTGGYLMIIHDLDLTTLHKDLCGFRPIIYRLMQMGQQYIPQAAKFDHVFSKKQKKNRVELVTDFPEKNDAEVILALQIHPRGHCFLSRNISYDGNTEWSTVHDLNEEPDDITERTDESVGAAKRKRKLNEDSDKEDNNQERNQDGSGDSTDDVLFNVNRRRRQRARMPVRAVQTASALASSSSASGSGSGSANVTGGAAAGGGAGGGNNAAMPSFVPDIWAAEVTVQERAIRQNRARSSGSVSGYNFVYAISSGVLPVAVGISAVTTTATTATRNSSSNARRGAASFMAYDEYAAPDATSAVNNDGSSTSSSNDSPPPQPHFRLHRRSLTAVARRAGNQLERQIFQNPKKLMYYVQELNKDKTFIKEPCFSSDGRIVCSPYDTGVRLLAFTDSCSEYPHHHIVLDKERKPRPLVEVLTIKAHSDIVLSTKFSPREPLLVTGCRSGKVVWYHPNL